MYSTFSSALLNSISHKKTFEALSYSWHFANSAFNLLYLAVSAESELDGISAGVGGGFALGAALCNPEKETWIIWGDGSAAYSLAEFDTFVRHGLPVIGVVGTDASHFFETRQKINSTANGFRVWRVG